MGLFERGGLLRPVNTWSGDARSADLRRRCPPVDDCAAQNARPARPTGKQKRAAARVAAAQAKARRDAAALRTAARAAKNQPQEPAWPNKGRYNPPQRGRG